MIKKVLNSPRRQASYAYNRIISLDYQKAAKGGPVHEHAQETRMMLQDFTKIIFPEAFKEEVLLREHIYHAIRVKMYKNIRSKCYWPRMEKDVMLTVEACMACQTHRLSQKRELLRLAL